MLRPLHLIITDFNLYVYGGEAIKSELNIQFFIPTQPYKLQISVSFPHDAF